MPRRRQRKTNRVPQDERRLRVRAQRRDVPDTKRLSRAFIGLALAQAEAEAKAQAEATADRPTTAATAPETAPERNSAEPGPEPDHGSV